MRRSVPEISGDALDASVLGAKEAVFHHDQRRPAPHVHGQEV